MTLGEFRALTKDVSASTVIAVANDEDSFGVRSVLLTRDKDYLVIEPRVGYHNALNDVRLSDGETILYYAGKVKPGLDTKPASDAIEAQRTFKPGKRSDS